MLLKNRMA